MYPVDPVRKIAIHQFRFFSLQLSAVIAVIAFNHCMKLLGGAALPALR